MPSGYLIGIAADNGWLLRCSRSCGVMRNEFLWIIILLMLRALVSSAPVHHHHQDLNNGQMQDHSRYASGARLEPNGHNGALKQDGEVISVRITSSVAVDRGTSRHHIANNHKKPPPSDITTTVLITETTEKLNTDDTSDLPTALEGANVEFIKQLNAKKEARGLHKVEHIHSYNEDVKDVNDSDDSAIGESVKSILEIPLHDSDRSYENVPLARSVPQTPAQRNYFHGLTHKPLHERRNPPRLTTVNFDIVHNTPKVTTMYEPPNTPSDQTKSYSEPEKFYSEPPKFYSQPAKVYSEPAKIYSEPAKIYSEPAKIYSEPAKIYSEPSKIYSEPAKFYSQAASLHLPPPSWQAKTDIPLSSTFSTTPVPNKTPTRNPVHHRDHQPEKNYEVDEKISVMTDGRSHGVQETNENCKDDNCKVGYVVEGRQYRKYRVEERTSDGFIVGEYGVVRNEDGALRGVRYTADSDASPRLIYDALMKFLQLQ